MVLNYSVHRLALGDLPFTDNKGEDVANARGKVVELITLHPWEV